jgi:hypothetical protein
VERGLLEDPEQAIFERMVILIPYKSPEIVNRIMRSFENLNMDILKLENATYLNTKELTEEERSDRTFDYLSGF